MTDRSVPGACSIGAAAIRRRGAVGAAGTAAAAAVPLRCPPARAPRPGRAVVAPPAGAFALALP